MTIRVDSTEPDRGGGRHGLPSCEEVFFAWLVRLPHDADIAGAARREIARIDRHYPSSPALLRLRALFMEAADAGSSGAGGKPSRPRR